VESADHDRREASDDVVDLVKKNELSPDELRKGAKT